MDKDPPQDLIIKFIKNPLAKNLEFGEKQQEDNGRLSANCDPAVANFYKLLFELLLNLNINLNDLFYNYLNNPNFLTDCKYSFVW